MPDDARIEGIASHRNARSRNDIVLRSRRKLNHAEVAGTSAEIGNQNQFARLESLRVRIGGPDWLILEPDVIESRNGVRPPQTIGRKSFVLRLAGTHEGYGAAHNRVLAQRT